MTERARLLRLVGAAAPPGRWLSRQRQPALAAAMSRSTSAISPTRRSTSATAAARGVLQYNHGCIFRWCPSIAWRKGLQSVVSRLLIESVAKVRGHTIAQQFLHGPHMVRQTCRHSRCDWLPLLG